MTGKIVTLKQISKLLMDKDDYLLVAEEIGML